MGGLGALWHLGHAAFNVAQFKAHFQGIQQWNFLGLPFTTNVSVEAIPVALPIITSYQLKPVLAFFIPSCVVLHCSLIACPCFPLLWVFFLCVGLSVVLSKPWPHALPP